MSLKGQISKFLAWQKAPIHHYSIQESSEHCCSNCGHSYVGNYCPVCGQSAREGRITWHSVWKSILSLFNVDSRALPYTLWQLIWRPGYLIGDYLGGRRQVCCHPVKMLFFLAVIYAVVMHIVQAFGGWQGDSSTVEISGSDYLSRVAEWLANNLGWAMISITIVLVLPTWILFRFAPKFPRHTLPEGFFVQLFMSSMLIVADFLSKISGCFLLLVPLYYYISYRQLFGYRFWGTLWRLLLCALIWLFALLFLSMVVVIYGIKVVSERVELLRIAVVLLVLIVANLAVGYLISRKNSNVHGS